MNLKGGLVILFFSLVIHVNAKDTLRVGLYHSPPFVEVNTDGSLSGISYWLWEQGFVNEQDNVQYEFISYTNNETPLASIIKDLETSKIDMCLNPLTVTPQRNKKLSFSHPFYVSNLTIASSRASAFQKAKEFLIQIFSPTFWRTIFALFLVILFFGALVWLFERKNQKSHFNSGWKGILHGIWWSAVTMTTVGYGDKVPKTAGGRIVALIWMFTAIMIISGFTATITSSLTIDRIQADPGTLSEFKTKKVATVEGSATSVYLSQHYFRNKQLYPELTLGLKALENGEIEAFIYDEPWLRHHIEKTDAFNKLEVLPIRFNVDLYAFAFRKEFPTLRLQQFNQDIISIRESKEWQLILDEHHLSEI